MAVGGDPRPATATQEAPDFAAIIRAAVNEAVAPLQEQVNRLQAGQPRFVKLPPAQRRRNRTYEPPDDLKVRSLKLHQGESANGQTRWLDTDNGRAGIPNEYRPIFRPGDVVRLNPDINPWGSVKTWGEVLPQIKDNPQGVGEVVCTMYMTETWEPKYKVQIRGLTTGSGDGFRESELLPYDDFD